MYSRLAKVFFFTTILFFVVAFLYVYASLPEKVTYEINEQQNTLKEMSRNVFFFVTLAILMGANLLIVVPAKMVENQVLTKTKGLFKKGSPFRESMLTWIYSFGGIFNVNLVVLLWYILLLNSFVKNESSGFSIIFYLVPLLLVGWIVALFVLLGKKIQQVQISRSNINNLK